jgi:hypothetical protein
VPLGVTGKVLKTRLRERYRSLEDYLAESDGKLLATSISPASAVPAG